MCLVGLFEVKYEVFLGLWLFSCEVEWGEVIVCDFLGLRNTLSFRLFFFVNIEKKRGDFFFFKEVVLFVKVKCFVVFRVFGREGVL